jgi:hypothetical protein
MDEYKKYYYERINYDLVSKIWHRGLSPAGNLVEIIWLFHIFLFSLFAVVSHDVTYSIWKGMDFHP